MPRPHPSRRAARGMAVPVVAVAAPLLVLAVAGPATAQVFQDQTAARFPSPNPSDYTNYVTISDIDGDGDLDLLFANGGNFGGAGSPQLQRIYVNDGTGVFTDETLARIGNFTGNYRGVAAGDVDGDGDEDLLYSSDYGRQPRLFLNDGTGVFTDVTATHLPALLLSSTRAAFGDLDDDGDLDVYINDGGPTNRFGCGQNRVLMNDGTGVFADETSSRHPLGNVCEPMDAILGDIDGDLDLDVRTGNRGTGNSKLYRNDGAGVFADVSGNVPSDSACYSYDFGDMDGDGDLDLLGANAGASNRELLLANDGSGVFTDLSALLLPNTTGDDNDSKFFDFDDDGDMDIVIAALFQGQEKIYRSDGARWILETGAITPRSDATLDVEVADLDGDGDYDMVTAQGESGSFQNRIYMNTEGPADSRAPKVVNLAVTRDPAGPGPWPVRAMITDAHTSDRGFHDRGVELAWAAGGDEGTVAMRWVGNSMWRGELPAALDGLLVTGEVRATDFAGNVGTSDPLVVQLGTPSGPAADLDGDGVVSFSDLVILLAEWGDCPDPLDCPADLDGDGTVGFGDLVLLLTDWR